MMRQRQALGGALGERERRVQWMTAQMEGGVPYSTTQVWQAMAQLDHEKPRLDAMFASAERQAASVQTMRRDMSKELAAREREMGAAQVRHIQMSFG